MTQPYLSAITLYPIKSLAGISVNAWPLTTTGLQYDRKWMLIDREGQFLSQRRLPKMALVKTAIKAAELVVSAPDMADLHLSLTPTGNEFINSTIWRDQCEALHISAQADAWFSAFLQQDCRLVYQADELNRKVDPQYSLDTDRTAFSDGFPLLLIAEASLAALNQDLAMALPMTRFRPNLVVSGCSAYAEDSWREITIGDIGFRLPKPCSRCGITTLDPETAVAGKEPLTTLNRTRKWQNNVYFGQNALHDQTGILTVGDTLMIKSTGANQPPI